MTVAEQEALFKSLKEAHPKWTNKFCSGYVAGVVDEARHEQPENTFVKDADLLDPYALGYITGFAVHRGSDAELEPWFENVTRFVPRDGN